MNSSDFNVLPSSSMGSVSSSDDVQPVGFLLEEATSFNAVRNSSASIASALRSRQSSKLPRLGDGEPKGKPDQNETSGIYTLNFRVKFKRMLDLILSNRSTQFSDISNENDLVLTNEHMLPKNILIL